MKKFLNEYYWIILTPVILAIGLILIFTTINMQRDKRYGRCKMECSKLYPFQGIFTKPDMTENREKCKKECFNKIILKEVK